MNKASEDARNESRNEQLGSDVELERCPFCGCKEPIYDVSMELVYCPDCGIAVEYRYNKGIPPIAAWNQRPMMTAALRSRLVEPIGPIKPEEGDVVLCQWADGSEKIGRLQVGAVSEVLSYTKPIRIITLMRRAEVEARIAKEGI